MEKCTISQDMLNLPQSCSENSDDFYSACSNKEYCGVNIEELYYNNTPWNYYYPPLIPSYHHTVLFQVPVNLNHVPKPHCSQKAGIWDSNHVKMPFSPNNLFPVSENNKECVKRRWDVIQQSLLRPFENSYELEEAILSYNLNLKRRRFNALHSLFENVFSEEESDEFFNNILPKIIALALRLPELIKAPVPLLKQGKPHAISLSQLQIASLLANGFLCTFPSRKDNATYPGINFNGLYELDFDGNQEIMEKIKCLIHYFKRICTKEPTGVVTFERRHLPKSQFPRWEKVDKRISNTKLHITSHSTIEDGGKGMLQVDFANCMIGGGVLYWGCVQEEIRFVICPELLISRLFTEQLEANEALLMIGAECYSHYKGYASSFKWLRNCTDETPFDEYKRRRTSIIAIDAIHYFKSSLQFSPSKIIRELNKAYVGFYENPSNSPLAPVATGNWGCGAFGGNLHLKALIQIMACTAANRNIVYFTFGDKKLQYTIFNIYHFLASNNVTVAQLWKYISKFCESKIPPYQLLPYINQYHLDILKDRKEETKYNKKETFYNKTKQFTDANTAPSTSKEHRIVETSRFQPEVESDIIEASQEDIELPIFKSKPTELKSTTKKPKVITNMFKKIRDVSSLFYSSDEDSSPEKPESFLTEISRFENKAKGNDSLMEIENSSDESLKEICIVDNKKISDVEVKEKKKNIKPKKPLITDYFNPK